MRATFHERGVDAAAELVVGDLVHRAAGVELPLLAPAEGSLDLTIATLA